MFRVFCKKPPNCFHNGHSLFHGIMSLVLSLKSHHQPKVDVGLLRCSQFPCFELLVCVGLFHFGCELCHVCTNALFLFYGRQIPTTLVPGLCVAWGRAFKNLSSASSGVSPSLSLITTTLSIRKYLGFIFLFTSFGVVFANLNLLHIHYISASALSRWRASLRFSVFWLIA